MSDALSPQRNQAIYPIFQSRASSTLRTAQATTTRIGLRLLLSYLTLEYLRPQTFWPALASLPLPGIALAFLLVATIPQLLNGSTRLARQSWLLLAFLGLTALSVLYAANWFRAYKFTYGLALIMIAYFALAHLLRDERDMRKVLSLLVGVHIFLSIRGVIGFSQREFNEAGYSSTGYVGGAFLRDENDYALALNLILPLAVYLAVRSRSTLARLFWGIGCAILLLTTILTFSRGGFSGLAAMAIYWIIAAQKKGRPIAALVIGIPLVVAVAPTQYWDRISTIAVTDQGTAWERQQLWAAARLMFYDSPIFGVGGNNFGVHAPEYGLEFESERRPTLWGKAVHSMYFQLLAEFGLVGVILIGWTLFLNFRRLNEVVRLSKQRHHLASLALLASSLRASWIGFLVSAIFLSVLDFPHLYYFTALTVAFHRMALERAPRTSEDQPRPQ